MLQKNISMKEQNLFLSSLLDEKPDLNVTYLFLRLPYIIMDSKPRRRLPAKERTISDIQADKDVRVRIMGTVIGLSGNSLMVDDGSSHAEILFDKTDLLTGLKEGQLVKVVTRILPLIDGYECRGEAVQDLTGININLYKQVRGLI